MADLDIEVLINKEHLLPRDYIPHNLVVLDNNEGNFRNYMDKSLKPMLRSELIYDLWAMFEDAKKQGFSLIVNSAYRSYDYQEFILNERIGRVGEEEAYKYVALPGTSEHQSGLCFDLAYYYDGIFNDSIKDTDDEVKWLMANSYKYGFILRFPKGKEKITGYAHEPWHYRYVGKELAKTLYENQETLEEYYIKKRKSIKRKALKK